MNAIGWLLEHYRRGGLLGIHDWIRYDLTGGYECIKKIDNVAEFWDVNEDGYVSVQLPGYRLFIDPDDPGISTELLSRGIREPGSYYHYRRVLRQLPDDPLILEAGANIGYYALAAAVERPDANIICVELSEENVKHLRYNAEKNNLTDQLTIKQVALSDSTGTKEVDMAAESNQHSLERDPTDDSINVNCMSGDELLDNYDHTAANVDCLRMDTEGHELAILRGLTEIRPSVAHIETHPHYLNNNDFSTLCDYFNRWDTNIVGVYKGDKKFSVDRPLLHKASQIVFADINK